MIWANLLHLGYNLYMDTGTGFEAELDAAGRPEAHFDPALRVDDRVWAEVTEAMADAGFTAVVLDLADGVAYQSHPEIAVAGAWSTDRLRAELARLRGMGLEPLPKLNFSAGHDAWLGEYARQVSTKAYYRVCADLVGEVGALFDTPRLFHLGMDEEDLFTQRMFEYVVIRQHDLWWRDLGFLAGEVERAGSRPWVWSDPAWRHPEEFYRRMPASIVQSNWYYESSFDADEQPRPRDLDLVSHPGEQYLAYLDLDEHGYDQIPTASTFSALDNLARTVEFCTGRCDPARLLGFLQTTWRPTTVDYRTEHLEAVAVAAEVIRDHPEVAGRGGAR